MLTTGTKLNKNPHDVGIIGITIFQSVDNKYPVTIQSIAFFTF